MAVWLAWRTVFEEYLHAKMFISFKLLNYFAVASVFMMQWSP
jgi:hypothetical protein